MRLTPPRQTTFWASLSISLLGIVGHLIPSLPLVSPVSFWLVVLGFTVLVMGNIAARL